MDPVLPQFDVWSRKRRHTINALYNIADKLDDHHKKVNKSRIAGSSAALSGAVVAVGSAILMPLTGGLSAVPALVGAGLGVAGTVTSGAAQFVESRLAKGALNETQTLIDDDLKSLLKIEKVINTISNSQDSVVKYLEEMVEASLTTVLPQQEMMKQENSDMSKVAKWETKISQDVLSGIAKINIPPVLTKGFQIARKTNFLNINTIFNTGKQAIKERALQVSTSGKILNSARFLHVTGIILNVALLPVDIYDLVTTVIDLKKGKGHEASVEIRRQADQLAQQLEDVRDYLMTTVAELNNFVLLIRHVQREGCTAYLNSILNQILKKLLPTKDIVKAFDTIELQEEESFSSESIHSGGLSAILINCDGIKNAIFKELAVVVWSAWKMGNKSVLFLQNTNLTIDPILWTLFGVSVNCFGTESERGVSILFPLDFDGEIMSSEIFADRTDKDSDWNGRCIVVNVTIVEEKYTLANILAPDGSMDRKLFLKEASAFVGSHKDGRLIVASNFRTEVPTMTVVVHKRASSHVPLSLIQKFISYRSVCEYLIYRPHSMNEPADLVDMVCGEYMLPSCGPIIVNWSQCRKPILTIEDYSDQLQPLLRLGVTDLWQKKNSGFLEFSMEHKSGHRVITSCQNLDFFVKSEMEEEISHCKIEHSLRFLGFLKQSAMMFQCKSGNN